MEPGVKVNSAYYCEHMLQQCYWPGILANLAMNERYHFYADNAPSHVSASTREFIQLNKPHNEELLAVPASSLDLSVCDYYLWKAIQDRLQPRWHTCGAPRGHPAPGPQSASPGDPTFHLFLATEAAEVPHGRWRTLRGLSRPISMAPCAKTRTNGVNGILFSQDISDTSHSVSGHLLVQVGLPLPCVLVQVGLHLQSCVHFLHWLRVFTLHLQMPV